MLSLLAAFVGGFLVGGGPTLWLALLVGLAVYGGDPGDPLTAAVATVLVLWVTNLARSRLARHLRRR